jgi:hypothetical protein
VAWVIWFLWGLWCGAWYGEGPAKRMLCVGSVLEDRKFCMAVPSLTVIWSTGWSVIVESFRISIPRVCKHVSLFCGIRLFYSVYSCHMIRKDVQLWSLIHPSSNVHTAGTLFVLSCIVELHDVSMWVYDFMHLGLVSTAGSVQCLFSIPKQIVVLKLMELASLEWESDTLLKCCWFVCPYLFVIFF